MVEVFPKFKERGEEEQEMLRGLEKSFIVLCEQMKTEIETGVYDALIIDDSGGRIPTLLFRYILKLIKPEQDLETLFVASGKSYFPKNSKNAKELSDYLRDGLKKAKRVLVVTQHIHKGDTIQNLVRFIKSIGIQDIDVATVDTNDSKDNLLHNIGCDNLFVGDIQDKRQLGFTENHNILSGISKSREYNPKPMRLDLSIESGNRNRSDFLDSAELDKIFEIDKYDTFEIRQQKRFAGETKLDEIDSIPLSEEEKKDIQENINRTRLIVREMAERIIKAVWGKT